MYLHSTLIKYKVLMGIFLLPLLFHLHSTLIKYKGKQYDEPIWIIKIYIPL